MNLIVDIMVKNLQKFSKIQNMYFEFTTYMGLIVSFNFSFTVHHTDLVLRPLTTYYFFSIRETYCKANNLLCHARYEFS